MKRKLSLFLTLWLALLCVLCAVGCGEKDKSNLKCTLVESTQTRVVISVSDPGLNCTLLDCMEILRQSQDTDFTFTFFNGMITSINGVENPADWSYCWMLYTSDEEMANTAWGTTGYEGKTLGSAIVGASELDVIAGGVYVWSYDGFKEE